MKTEIKDRTYTEEEVDILLDRQRSNCWMALANAGEKDKDKLVAVLNAPEPLRKDL